LNYELQCWSESWSEVIMTGRWLRWLPAAAVPAMIAAGVLTGSLPASAGDPLPDKSPEQVLALIAQHREQGLPRRTGQRPHPGDGPAG
jgi:hypothetical protein